jgi:hypothetical protein
MTADRYWVSLPGSKLPPRGPMDLEAIRTSWNAGQLDPASTICKVGDTTWGSVDSVLGPPRPEPAAPPAWSAPAASAAPIPAGPTAPTPARSVIEAQYMNLARVAKGLIFYSRILKLIGYVVVAGSVVASFVFWIYTLVSEQGRSMSEVAVAVGLYGVSYGVSFIILAIIAAGTGEALFALRDIAVNTRIAADK